MNMSDIALGGTPTGPKVSMTITVEMSGQVHVNFPPNPMLCDHMLAEARRVVDQWKAERSAHAPPAEPRVHLAKM